MYHPIILTESYDGEITGFLNSIGKNNPSVLGYHYPLYRKMLEKIGVGKPLYIGLLDHSDKVIAILPGFIKTQKEGSLYCSLPFFGPNSGVLFDKTVHDPHCVYSSILSFLFSELEKHEMISASFYSAFYDNDDYTEFERLVPDPVIIDKFTNFISLASYNPISSVKNHIRKAIKSGVTIRDVRKKEDIDTIYSIYTKNCEDYGIPLKPFSCVEEIIEVGNSGGFSKTYIAETGDKIIGALIIIYSPSTASYYLPCSIHEYRIYQPMPLLIDHAIKESILRGTRFWNWESSPSKDSGVYKFKKDWGSLDGTYKIFVRTYKDFDFYRQLGQNRINGLFPYYYVYPFNRI